eukprot:COSAG02_NODE_512_length_20850_cov_4.993302_10_plen_651_part_00
MEARRAELVGLRIGALKKQARSAGVDMGAVETAIDEAEEPKSAIIELVLSAEAARAEGALRLELAQLRTIGALRKRAKAVGVDMDVVEEAIDEAESPKATLVELIVTAMAATAGSLPEGVAEKPGATAEPEPETDLEPEPEQESREVHAASCPAIVDVAGSHDWQLIPIQPSRTLDFLPALCIFGSMRFPVPDEARMLFAALQAAGVYLKIVDMKAGQDIDKEVYEWIEHCHAFLAFGTKNYGEDTGNSACTYNEVKFAQAKKKNIVLLRMIPWEAEFEELQARVLFNRNMLTLEWQQGHAMPPSLVGEILKAMDLPMTGAPGSPAALAYETAAARSAAEAANLSRAQAEAAKAQAQAQLAQAQASAAAAKAQAEAAQVQAQAEEAMALAAAEEEAARRLREQARAAEAAERQRKEQEQARQRQEQQRASLLSELEMAEPARVVQILLMKQAAEDAELQAAGCKRLSGLSVADRANDSPIVAAAGMEAALKGMSSHKSSPLVQEQGCFVLRRLAFNDAFKPALVSSGGIETIVQSMGEHGGSAKVQEHGCNVLGNLAVNSDELRAAIASAGGIAAVVAGMGAHVGSAAVQEHGCGALWNISNNSTARAATVQQAGGLAAIATARAAFSGNAAVTQSADGAVKAIEYWLAR